MTNKEQLFFDHIPKTAGVSVTNALETIFGETARLTYASNQHSMAVSHSIGRRLVAGHVWFQPNEKLAEKFYYCTLLRDPVDRFLSQYYFNKSVASKLLAEDSLNDPHLRDPQVLASHHLSIEEYLNSSAHNLIITYTDIQAAHFAQRKCNNPWDLSKNDLLDAAISSLDDYDLIGTFDQLQAFIDRICVDFNRPNVELPKLNVNQNRKNKNDVSSAVIKKLHESNTVDLQLVSYAQQRFMLKGALVSATAPDKIIQIEGALPNPEKSRGATAFKERAIPPVTSSFGSKEIEIIQVECIPHSTGNTAIQTGDESTINLICEAHILEPDLTVGIAVHDYLGNLIYGTNSSLLGIKINIFKIGKFRITLKYRPFLGNGQYSATVALHKGVSHQEGCYHWINNAVFFNVIKEIETSPEQNQSLDIHYSFT